MATLCWKTSAMFIQPYLSLQRAGHRAAFTIYVLSTASVFGALSLCGFDAFIWADALGWAHKHSCNQKTEVFGVSVAGLQLWTPWFTPVPDCCSVLVQSRSALPAPRLAIAMVPIHERGAACFSGLLHEFCNLSTQSYHAWSCLNPRSTQIPLYYTAIRTAGIPRCTCSMPLLLARVGVVQR